MNSQAPEPKTSTPDKPAGAESISPRPHSPSAVSHLSTVKPLSRDRVDQPPAIPDYQLLQRIGGGSYGEVWLARSATGALRALKIVWRHTFDDDRPFQREFEGIQCFERLSREHPSQLALFHVGRGEGYFFYVMELADSVADDLRGRIISRVDDTAKSEFGEQVGRYASRQEEASRSPAHLPTCSPADYTPHTLRADLARGRLPAARVLEIALTLTSALQALHEAGLVHRDIKPSNIIFVGGRPKLADIGLVTDTGDARSIVGTEGYLAPEGPGAPQADIFALGKVLYEAATGLDRRHFPQLPSDLRTWPDAALVFELNETFLKACAPDSKRRYTGAEEMQADLELLETGGSVKRGHTLRQRWELCKRVSIAAVLLTLATSAALFFSRDRHDANLYSTKPEVETLMAEGNFEMASGTPERLNTALGAFTKAAELDPAYPPTRVGLFRVRFAQQYYFAHPASDAISNLFVAATNLMKVAPYSAEARIAQTYINEPKSTDSQTLENARKAARMRSVSKEGRGLVQMLYGRYLMMNGFPDEALNEYRIAEQVFRADPAIKTCLGLPYLAKRDLRQALKHFQDAIRLEDRFFLAHYWASRVYEDMGDFPKAIGEFEKRDVLAGEYKGKSFYDALLQASERDGPKGYWSKRLEQELGDLSPNRPYRIPAILARLGGMDEGYQSLEEARKTGKYGKAEVLLDQCWNRNDEQFKVIARRFGLTP